MSSKTDKMIISTKGGSKGTTDDDHNGKALRDQAWKHTACAILDYIEHNSSKRRLRPADVARRVCDEYVTEYWDPKSETFKERRPQQILDVMGNIVGRSDRCLTRSKTELANKGHKVCTKNFLRDIRYGKFIPFKRSTPVEDKSTAVATEKVDLLGSTEVIAAESRTLEPPQGEEWVEVGSSGFGSTAEGARATRQRRRPSRFGFTAPSLAPSNEQGSHNKSRKCQISPASLPDQERTGLFTPTGAVNDAHGALIQASRTDPRQHMMSSPQTSYPFLDSTDFYLDDDSLESQMRHLHKAACSFVDSQAFPSQQLRLQQTARFFLAPERDVGLARLYESQLGTCDGGDSMHQICVTMQAPELAKSLVGCFLGLVAFAHPELEMMDRWRQKRFALPEGELIMLEKLLSPLGMQRSISRTQTH